MMTLGIYFVRVDNLWVLGDTMMTIARNPVDIYGLVAQRFFLYVLPIALLGTVPARQLTRGATVHDLTLSLAWAFALRAYSSASS
jgi:ABC-2 type transport system permease protein